MIDDTLSPWGFTAGDVVRQVPKPHAIPLGLGMVTTITPTRVVVQFRPECRLKSMKPGSLTRTGLRIVAEYGSGPDPSPLPSRFIVRCDAGGKIGGGFISAVSALRFMRNDSGKEDSKL